MAIYTELLACKVISEVARYELGRAGCTIHKKVPGLASDIEVVELQHAGKQDRKGTNEKGVPHEVEITSRGLFLSYQWEEEINGYSLITYDEQKESDSYHRGEKAWKISP